MLGLACCRVPADDEAPPIGFCSIETSRNDVADPSTETLRLSAVVLFAGGGGVWIAETATFDLDTPVECTDGVCATTTRNIYEVRWEPTPSGYVLSTPGPDPLTWHCAVRPGGVNVDCTVTHADFTQDTWYFSARVGGRTKDGQPWRMFQYQADNYPCIRSDTEHEAFYEDYWASW